MVAELCLGKVSAVCGTGRDLALCPQQPRPAARHLVCHVDTVLIDQETIYAPRQGNDRLLPGLKGEPQTSMSWTFCSCAHSRRYDEAPRARRCSPVFFAKVGDQFPDRRVQEAINLVFERSRYLAARGTR